jgi:hypothetical protein
MDGMLKAHPLQEKKWGRQSQRWHVVIFDGIGCVEWLGRRRSLGAGDRLCRQCNLMLNRPLCYLPIRDGVFRCRCRVACRLRQRRQSRHGRVPHRCRSFRGIVGTFVIPCVIDISVVSGTMCIIVGVLLIHWLDGLIWKGLGKVGRCVHRNAVFGSRCSWSAWWNRELDVGMWVRCVLCSRLC